MSKDVYKIIKGKNEIDINVRKLTNHIKKDRIKPAFLNYSTVTDFARFLGWSTLQQRITAI